MAAMAASSLPYALIMSRMRLATGAAILTQECQAVHARHADIGEDDVRPDVRRPCEGTPSVSLGGHLVTGLGEQESQRLPETRIVINDQNAHQPPLLGQEHLEDGPALPGAVHPDHSPASCTVRATMANPSPVPCPGSFVV